MSPAAPSTQVRAVYSTTPNYGATLIEIEWNAVLHGLADVIHDFAARLP
jgi:hypothetical protein